MHQWNCEKGISFKETCDRMRSFRDKYAEVKYTGEEIKDMFAPALKIIEEYEKGEKCLGENIYET
jgi:hypothetical protein